MTAPTADGIPGLVLQHDPDAPPALLGEWLERRGIAWRRVELWRQPVPELGRAPFVVALGSEHSAAASEPEWIAEEIELLRRAVRLGAPVLGLCFGGQALALALGGEIHPARPAEIGWDEIASLDRDAIPPGRWVNFHYESFTLPPGATLLARSAAGPAAFRLGRHVGLQFHPEATPAIADSWGAERSGDPDVDVDRLAADGERHGAGAARRAAALFDRWWALAGPGGDVPPTPADGR